MSKRKIHFCGIDYQHEGYSETYYGNSWCGLVGQCDYENGTDERSSVTCERCKKEICKHFR